MPDLIKDYVCSDADVHLTSGDPVEAMLTFLTPEKGSWEYPVRCKFLRHCKTVFLTD
jgi:hypothetical protein